MSSLPTPYWVQSGWRYYKGWIWAWSYVESFSPTTGYAVQEYSIHNWGDIIEYKVEWTGGTTQIVDPGDYIPVNAINGVYEILDGRAISIDDEWVLEELIAYIKNSVSQTP